MPRGFQEQYFIELVPDFDQKKKWLLLEEQARGLGNYFSDEIERQVAILGSPVGKNLYMGAKSGEGIAPDIVEPARQRIKEQAYDNFRQDISKDQRIRASGRRHYSLELSPDEVHFSVESWTMRIPYVGLIKYRKNKKILSDSEGSRWAMGNITSMRMAMKNRYLCLVIDTREDPSLKTKKKPPAKGKSSKWLE